MEKSFNALHKYPGIYGFWVFTSGHLPSLIKKMGILNLQGARIKSVSHMFRNVFPHKDIFLTLYYSHTLIVINNIQKHIN